MNPDKTALRDRMRAVRSMVASAERASAIQERLFPLPVWARARVILAYHSMGSEAGTDVLIKRALEAGKTVCLPAIVGRGLMEARRMDRLIPGPYGIPSPQGPIIAPAEIDLILVPGLAFDRDCHRLGQGGGYYDRYLPLCRGVTIGLFYDCQMADDLPIEPHDAQLDYVLTETTLYKRPTVYSR